MYGEVNAGNYTGRKIFKGARNLLPNELQQEKL